MIFEDSHEDPERSCGILEIFSPGNTIQEHGKIIQLARQNTLERS